MEESVPPVLSYNIKDPLELNLSYMPFIKDGGLFIPTTQTYALGSSIVVELQLPGKKEVKRIDGKVVWITPKNALHHVSSGIGIQFVGDQAKNVKNEIEMALDTSLEVGGYTYGITEQMTKKK